MSDLLQRLQDAVAGRYRLERELGRGGMATVFLAEDLKHHRRVAIKVLDPEVGAAIGPERFLLEIETAARLTHPHILPLHDSGAGDGLLFYVMPYVEGESLRDQLIREKQLALEDALRVAREVADALSYAHSRGVIHRDIKPENILLGEGHAVVADFGISRAVAAAGGENLTGTGVVVGTPAYMSPEQATGSRDLDGRSDLYSLGCVLYEMLAGVPPFAGTTAASIAHQHLNATPRPVTELRPSVPAVVAAALQRALAKAPADRFNPVAQFGEALGQGGTSVSTKVERSRVAVLPFQNLSAEDPNAYFAGGLHDELLTQLATVAALKTISRTSVMGYAGTTKPVKQISAELGVGSIVEGSVQVAGNRLRVNVQLIDAATDEHPWAERYHRTLDDAFEIQSEVAQQIVAGVGAALTGDEQGRLAAPPTAIAEAYRLYLQGREYYLRQGYLRRDRETAQQLFERALALDPDFALAHAALSTVHGQMYAFRYDPSAARAARTREEAEVALRLAPDLPQAHGALGQAYYRIDSDYRRALDEFALALKGLPNSGELWRGIGYVRRRMGDWDGALAALETATQLDPRNADILRDLGGSTYVVLHRYADAIRAFDGALVLAPGLYNEVAVSKGWAYVLWQGQLATLREVLGGIPKDPEDNDPVELLLLERKPDELLQELSGTRSSVLKNQQYFVPAALYAAWAHELRGDPTAARAAFDSASALLDSMMKELPDDWRVHASRGWALAGLGRRDEALEEGHWLQRSEIYRRDAMEGPSVAEARALILARTGDAEHALDEIERLLTTPSDVSVHTLRLDPRWDTIREHPRFKALLAKHAHE